jgi:hypothetical protein
MPGSDTPGGGPVEEAGKPIADLIDVVDGAASSVKKMAKAFDVGLLPAVKDASHAISGAAGSLGDTVASAAETVGDAAWVITRELSSAAYAIHDAVDSHVVPVMGAIGAAFVDAEALILEQIAALDKMGGTIVELNRRRADLEEQLRAVRGTAGASTSGSSGSGGGAAGITWTPIVPGASGGSTVNLSVNVNNADARKVADTMMATWRSRGVDI